MTSPPDRWRRSDHVQRLQSDTPFDCVVVGGGIVGAGVALDLSVRGLRVAVLERADFASGTSSRSTKLLHGGIRYLPQFRFGLVREGLREQRVLARTADYLYEDLEFIIPIYRGKGFGDIPRWMRHPALLPLLLRIGLWFYDVLRGRWRRRRRRVDTATARTLVPALRPEGLRGGFLYHDAQTDDARLVLAVLKTAVARGAVAANWMEVTGAEHAAGGWNVIATDQTTGGAITIPARTVVAATGAFAPPGAAGVDLIDIVKSKGVHLVADLGDISLTTSGIVIPETDDERVLYVIPWMGKAIIGTTDTPYEGDPAHPVADDADIGYLLDHVRRYLDVGDAAPISAWAGLRALADEDGTDTAKASREHQVREAAAGFYQVAGGKLTGYRAIAAEVADLVADRLDGPANSRTDRVGLVGSGAGTGFIEDLRRDVSTMGFEPPYGDLLYRRYGTEATEIAQMLASSPPLRSRLGDGTTHAEVLFAARHEAAATLTDITLRRTRLSWFVPDHGRNDAPAIADVLAAELGWDGAERHRQLEAFEAELRAEGL